MFMEAHCMKCRTKRGMKDGREVTMKNGRMAMTGTCEKCGTTMYSMMKKK